MELDALLGEALDGKANSGSVADGEAALSQNPAVNHIARIRYTHDGMIDLIIANPAISQNQLAAQFGYTAAWISRIVTSDAFQARLAERKEELVDPSIRTSIEENFKALVSRSLAVLMEKLERPVVSDQTVLRSLELSSKALGYGARIELPPPPKSDAVDHLAHLANRLIDLQSGVRRTLNVQAQEVTEVPQVGPVPQPRSAEG